MIKLLLLILCVGLVGCADPNITNSIYYPYTVTVTGSYNHSKNSVDTTLNGGGVAVGLTWKLKEQKVELDKSNE